VKGKRGKIPIARQAEIRWAKIRNPNRKEQQKIKMPGSSSWRNGSGIHFDTAEIFSVVSMVLTPALFGRSDYDTGIDRSQRPQSD
jgi:hypothetical protein